MLYRITTLLFTACLVLLGCTETSGTNSEHSTTVTDSAGVQIVENTGPDIELTGTEVLRIGVLQGEAEYQFNQIGSVAIADDGGLWVAQGSVPVRRYDTAGQFVSELSGIGEGPGEFESIRTVIPTTEGILVQGFPWRADLFTPEGELLDSRMMRDEVGNFATPMGRTGGVWVFEWRESGAFVVPEEITGLFRETKMLSATGSLGGGLSPIITVETNMAFPRMFKGFRSAARSSYFFGWPEVVVSAAGGVYHSDPLEHAVYNYDPSGQIVSIIRREVTPTPLTDEILAGVPDAVRQEEAFRSGGRERTESYMRTRIDEVVEAQVPDGLPENLPVIDGLLATGDGGLWVRRGDRAQYPARRAYWAHTGMIRSFWSPEAMGPNRFDIFDQEGTYRGSVTLPDRFFPYVVTEDRIYGVLRDELDVEYVVGYEVK